MSSHQKVRRFRANPVEVAIFSVITLVFFHSVYSLFYETPVDYPAIFSNSVASTAVKGRSPASVPSSSSLMALNVQCDNPADAQDITASKVRITGFLCGMSDPDSEKK